MISGCCCKPAEQPWTYTVGLIERGQPELVVLGLDPLSAHEGITWVADRAKKGFSVPLNMRDPLDDFDRKLVDVPFDWLATDPGRMAWARGCPGKSQEIRLWRTFRDLPC